MKIDPVDYYNYIAEDYESLLNTTKDNSIRKDIATYFSKLDNTAVTLDYGGGTGLDLHWLCNSTDHIVFYEPAVNMRRKALERHHLYDSKCSLSVIDNTSLATWQLNDIDLPKAGTILMNFGVINYIEDLESLFKYLHEISTAESNLLINLLYVSTMFKFRKLWRSLLKSKISRTTLKAKSSYKGMEHETFLYDKEYIVKSASNYFKLHYVERLGNNSDFHLIHLVKL